MSEAKSADSRPYHHGDLRRALVEAPYHHFKDKAELLDAVAHEGWDILSNLMAEAKAGATGQQQLTALGIAYVCFARDNPALYRVMYDAARDKEALPEDMHDNKESAYCMVRDTMVEHGADPNDEGHLELASVAAWCGAHGLAEMAGFKQFDHLKAELGGERQFLEAVLNHMGLFPNPRHHC
jgi:AcrR family transcriptional regulator